MPLLNDVVSQKIAFLKAKKQFRSLIETERLAAPKVKQNDKTLISFSCNDYFGLSTHPGVIEAAISATRNYGVGAGASRLVTGNHPLYAELEKKLATHKHTEAARVFGSGYLANMGTIQALVGAGDMIVADKFVHACMIDAATLSGATLYRFAHNNIDHCRLILESHRHEHQNCLLLTETVFSMDGDRAPLESLSVLAKEHDGWLMTDDAHGLGVVENSYIADIQMGTLSKSLGTYGGYVCGSALLIEYLTSRARSLIFTTSLPPANIAAASKALDILEHSSDLRRKPLENAHYFTQLLGIKAAQSAIVPVIIGDNEKTLEAAKMLAENGFHVAAIRPPTVPENTARLRFAFNAQHTRDHIEKVAELLLKSGVVCAPSV